MGEGDFIGWQNGTGITHAILNNSDDDAVIIVGGERSRFCQSVLVSVPSEIQQGNRQGLLGRSSGAETGSARRHSGSLARARSGTFAPLARYRQRSRTQSGQVTTQAMKRFYKDAAASAAADAGYTVLLDGKAVKTPKRAVLSLPNLPLAEADCGRMARAGRNHRSPNHAAHPAGVRCPGCCDARAQTDRATDAEIRATTICSAIARKTRRNWWHGRRTLGIRCWTGRRKPTARG